MKNIILFDTSVATMNHGDEIIMQSLEKNASDIFEPNNVFKFPTHAPCFHFYQQLNRNPRYRFVRNADYKFICGTNIINNRMTIPWPFWNINIFNSGCYNNAVLVGVGVSGFPENSEKVSLYSRMLYSSFLSREYKHSVRDERTKRIVESICGRGSAINTGCPTIWGLNKEHCCEIPTKKADSVVFTLTDYSVSREVDQSVIDVLVNNYKNVYFWAQGTQDIINFKKMKNIDTIKLVPPSVKAFSDLLASGNIDYIGTRLHAGIYAMQHKVRSVILIVDNRAADMTETYNINAINRDALLLEEKLNSEFCTDIRIDQNGIDEWKQQFLSK